MHNFRIYRNKIVHQDNIEYKSLLPQIISFSEVILWFKNEFIIDVDNQILYTENYIKLIYSLPQPYEITTPENLIENTNSVFSLNNESSYINNINKLVNRFRKTIKNNFRL